MDRVEQESPNFPTWRRRSHTWGGYLFVYAPQHPMAADDGYLRHDKVILERKLGRILAKAERVTHLNGDTLDDSPENLELAPYQNPCMAKEAPDTGDNEKNPGRSVNGPNIAAACVCKQWSGPTNAKRRVDRTNRLSSP